MVIKLQNNTSPAPTTCVCALLRKHWFFINSRQIFFALSLSLSLVLFVHIFLYSQTIWSIIIPYRVSMHTHATYLFSIFMCGNIYFIFYFLCRHTNLRLAIYMSIWMSKWERKRERKRVMEREERYTNIKM